MRKYNDINDFFTPNIKFVCDDGNLFVSYTDEENKKIVLGFSLEEKECSCRNLHYDFIDVDVNLCDIDLIADKDQLNKFLKNINEVKNKNEKLKLIMDPLSEIINLRISKYDLSNKDQKLQKQLIFTFFQNFDNYMKNEKKEIINKKECSDYVNLIINIFSRTFRSSFVTKIADGMDFKFKTMKPIIIEEEKIDQYEIIFYFYDDQNNIYELIFPHEYYSSKTWSNYTADYYYEIDLNKIQFEIKKQDINGNPMEFTLKDKNKIISLINNLKKNNSNCIDFFNNIEKIIELGILTINSNKIELLKLTSLCLDDFNNYITKTNPEIKKK
jgi:hypothetical protein